MDKKILVTGGAGFIGSHLVDELIDLGNDVRIVDNLDPQVHGENQVKPEYLNPNAEFIQGDVRDKEILDKALEDVQVVYHEAAAVGVGQSMYQIDYYVDVNCRGTGLLLEKIVNGNYDIEKLVVASSMSIYGEGVYSCGKCGEFFPDGRPNKQLEQHLWEMQCPSCDQNSKPVPTTEEKPLKPTSVYAVTKRDQEELVLSIGRAYGIPSVALRYFNVYGPRQSLSNPYTGVCAIFQSNIKNDNPPIVYEDGLQSRDFIHVKDIVAANIIALESSKLDYEAVNVGTGNPVSIYDVAKVLTKLYGRDFEPNVQNKFRSGDIRHCYPDISKLKKAGFEPKWDFESGMKDLVEWGRTQKALDMSQNAHSELVSRDLVEK